MNAAGFFQGFVGWKSHMSISDAFIFDGSTPCRHFEHRPDLGTRDNHCNQWSEINTFHYLKTLPVLLHRHLRGYPLNCQAIFFSSTEVPTHVSLWKGIARRTLQITLHLWQVCHLSRQTLLNPMEASCIFFKPHCFFSTS